MTHLQVEVGSADEAGETAAAEEVMDEKLQDSSDEE